MFDDILGKADSAKDAFEEITETPLRSTFKPKKENYWDKKDIVPLEIDVSKFSRTGKSFAIYIFPENDVPEEAANTIKVLAKALMEKGYTLRHTGHKDNVLQTAIASQEGAVFQSYLPWKKFNTDVTDATLPNDIGYRTAITIHKAFMRIPETVRAIVARDTNALLGTEATDPVDFVLAWSDGGAETLGKNADFKKIGTNTFTLQVAKRANIPVLNVFNTDFIERFKEIIK